MNDDFWPSDNECFTKSSFEEETIVKKNKFVKEKNTQQFLLPNLIGEDYPENYLAVVNRFLEIYKTLPLINYDQLYDEISELNVMSEPTPTLQLINIKLQKIQANKDRLSEIYQETIKCYTFKKRAVNILHESWCKFAEGSSQDKRRSDASFRLSEFYSDLAQIESLYNVCDHVLKNLDSQSNAISRQITIVQSQLKLFEFGRGALPDFDFNKSSLNDFGSSLDFIQSEELNDVQNIKNINEPEELSF